MNTQQNTSRLRRSVVAASALGTAALLVVAAPLAAFAHDGANSAPIGGPDFYSTLSGMNIGVSAPGVFANDSDPDGDTFSLFSASQPSHGIVGVNNGDGTLGYTPEPGFVGTDSFTYRIIDQHGAFSESIAVTIEVLPPNSAPSAQDDYYQVQSGDVLSVADPGPLANDSDPDGDSLQVLLLGAVSHGTVTWSNGGGFAYTPAPGFVGTDTMTYLAQEVVGGQKLSNLAHITIDVVEPAAEPANPVPTAVADFFTTSVNTSVGGWVTTNDLVDSGVLSAQLAAPAAAHGTVTFELDGSFDYTPDPGFVGTDTFGYQALSTLAQPWLASETALVTIEVLGGEQLPEPPANLAPVAGDDSYTVQSGVLLEVFAPGVLSNDSDPDGDAIAFHLVTGAQHGVFQHLGGGWFQYTSVAGYVGTDTITYQAEEVGGDEKQSALATITIDVTGEELETQGVPCSPTQPGGCDEPGDESGDEPGGDISTLALTGSDGSSWIVLGSFLLIYAGGMALRFARRHPFTSGDEA